MFNFFQYSNSISQLNSSLQTTYTLGRTVIEKITFIKACLKEIYLFM